MLQLTSSFTLPALLSPLQVLVVWKHWRSAFVTDRTATKVLFGNAAGTMPNNNGWSVIMPAAFVFTRFDVHQSPKRQPPQQPQAKQATATALRIAASIHH